VHVHKKFGLADYAVLELLGCGCDGIWCSAAPEGSGVGHACSVMALANLARLGNPHVVKKFHMDRLFNTAIEVTKRSTNGELPPPKAELLGSDAFDQVFSSSAAMAAGGGDFDVAEFLGQNKHVRITTFADADMYVMPAACVIVNWSDERIFTRCFNVISTTRDSRLI
jgi:hypothetical protein